MATIAYHRNDPSFNRPAGLENFDFESAYKAAGWGDGIAWRAFDYEAEADEDTEWTGMYVATGLILCHMVGDDTSYGFDPDDLTPIGDDEYCSGCGQIGCGWGH